MINLRNMKKHRICVQKKITEIDGLRLFEDISRRCEPSNVVTYFFGPP